MRREEVSVTRLQMCECHAENNCGELKLIAYLTGISGVACGEGGKL